MKVLEGTKYVKLAGCENFGIRPCCFKERLAPPRR